MTPIFSRGGSVDSQSSIGSSLSEIVRQERAGDNNRSSSGGSYSSLASHQRSDDSSIVTRGSQGITPTGSVASDAATAGDRTVSSGLSASLEAQLQGLGSNLTNAGASLSSSSGNHANQSNASQLPSQSVGSSHSV